MSERTLPIEPVQRRKLHDEVAAQLQALILSAQLDEGEALPSERDLMRRFGVGRPAVRQALLTLESAGLVRVSSGERTRVARPSAAGLVRRLSGPVKLLLATPDNVRHLQQARLFFEAGLSRHAAANATPADVGRIAAAWETNRQALGRAEEFARTDVAFHHEIAAVAGNPIIAGLGDAMWGWLTEQRLTAGRQPGATELSVVQHRQILDAIAAHDPDRAERAMREHLAAVGANYWRARTALADQPHRRQAPAKPHAAKPHAAKPHAAKSRTAAPRARQHGKADQA